MRALAVGLVAAFVAGVAVVAHEPAAVGREPVTITPERTIEIGAPRQQHVRGLESELPEPAPREVPLLPAEDLAEYEAAKAAANAAAADSRAAGPEPAAGPTALGAPKAKGVNRNGVKSTQSDSLVPDTHGAVGPKHYVEVANRRFLAIKKKNPSQVTTDISLATFFDYNIEALVHPQVVYDDRDDRWVVTAQAFPESSTVQKLLLAVSADSDPNGNYAIYEIDVDFDDNGNFLDRPLLGFNHRAIVLTANIFDDPPPATGTYLETDVLVIRKDDAYTGEPLVLDVLDMGATGSIAPPVVLDKEDNVFLLQSSMTGSTLPLWRGSNFGGTTPSVALVNNVPVPLYSVPPDAPQPATTALLDTSDGRFLGASTQYRERIWNVHTTNDLGIATPRFYEIDSTFGSALQAGNFWADDSSSDFNASIAANKLGEAFVTWTSVNAMLGINAEVRYSGRELHDTLNTIKRPGKVLFASHTFYDPTVNAVEDWGAYSSVALDPQASQSCPKQRRAWIVNETIKDTDVWSSRIGRIGYC